MGKSNQIVGSGQPNRQTSADLTRNYAVLAQKVLADPSVFPDEFTAWIPRWIMQNVNFKVQQGQLPTFEAFKLVGGTGNPAFQNSWANFGSSNEQAGFARDPWGVVHLVGAVKSGTVAANSTGTIFQLPAGYRPQYPAIFAVASNGAFGLVTVQVDGSVRAEVGNNTYFSLSGITFRAYA